MDTQREKIDFYFDKNIWSDITSKSESDLKDFLNMIKPLKEQLKIRIHYSPVGVLELIKGMKLEEHYQKCQYEIRIADRVTDKHILEHPWDHVRRSANPFLNEPFKHPDLSFLNLCKMISTLPYDQVEPRIRPIRHTLNRFDKEWTNNLNYIKSLTREKLDLEKTKRNLSPRAEEFTTDKWTMIRKQRLWISFCDHCSLTSRLKSLLPSIAYDNFHSFRYWVDYRLTYENKLFYENKKPESGDYLDWEQVVYLNIMDYLVTDDRKFRTVLGECHNREMHSVAITYDQFCQYLQRGLPPKRAPDSTSEQWYDAD